MVVANSLLFSFARSITLTAHDLTNSRSPARQGFGALASHDVNCEALQVDQILWLTRFTMIRQRATRAALALPLATARGRPEFLNLKPIILTGVGIQPTTDQGQSVYALLSLPKAPGIQARVANPGEGRAPSQAPTTPMCTRLTS